MQALGIKVIAEGIERLEELEIVSRFGIDLFQGFYLERPGPVLSDAGIDIPGRQSDVYECTDPLVSSCVIGSTCRSVEPLAQHRMIKDVLDRIFAGGGLDSGGRGGPPDPRS
ncbi:MAG: EAL domain-containing protein [Desulfoarculaceae bacterium]|nr:EAL domain-containing protein [Desulfoarculaceae bacterium]